MQSQLQPMKKRLDRIPSDLPQRPDTHVIGDQAVLALRNTLPNQWIYRETSPDYGIDGEIEVVMDDGTVTGGFIKCQVKGTASSVRIQKGGLAVSLTTVRYWITLPVPTILVRVTENPDEIHWLDVRQHLQHKGELASIYETKRKSIFFDFQSAYRLPDTVTILEELALSHQRNVSAMNEVLEEFIGTHVVGFVILLGLFDGNPDAMIKWLREKASLEQLADDLAFAIWAKDQVEHDPNFLDYARSVVESSFNLDIATIQRLGLDYRDKIGS